MTEPLYKTATSEFGFFTSEADRKNYEGKISLTINVSGEVIDLYEFSTIETNNRIDFAYKHKKDEDGNAICLYWFDNKCSGRFLEIFFNKCRKLNITPIDITNSIRDALHERKSLEKARKLKEKK